MDYNRRLIAWCRRNLPGQFFRNHLKPPLPANDEEFDIVYLMSVFTHLSVETQRAWLAELHRVTRPDGLILLTFHDQDHVTLPKGRSVQEELLRTGSYLMNAQGEGSNFMATFQTREFAERLFGEVFLVREIHPTGSSGIGQALAVLQRPS